MKVEEALGEYFEKSRLPVLFAGAGVSAQGGLPAWPTYLTSLAAAAGEYDPYIKYVIDKAISDGALTDAASFYFMCRDMPDSRKLLALQQPLLKFDWEKLAHLAKLPFQAVATTNFDRVLFTAYAKAEGVAAREVNIDDPTLSAAKFDEDFFIARIHGRVELPLSMRLSTEHFALLPRNEPYVGFLEHLFTRRQVLFLGFSFLDPAIATVLRSVREKTEGAHGQEHWALVPRGIGAEFVAELERHSIRRIEYDPSNHHQELWDGIEAFARQLAAKAPIRADVRDVPFASAKRYLANAYARSRLGRQREPLAQAMAEGVVSGMISKAGAGITEGELVVQVVRELTLPEDVTRTLVARALSDLTRDGICGVTPADDAIRYVPRSDAGLAYDSAVSRLVDGVVQRFRLQEGGVDTAEVRSYLAALVGELLLQRGWELGAAYAGRRMPSDVDLSSVMDRVSGKGVRNTDFIRIERALKDLLTRPDDEEAILLADLGRTAFGLELLLESPHDSLFLKRALPERLYFDANVVMPAITKGHPLHELFAVTIQTLKDAAGAAASGPSLRVYDGFLNEIVSHRRLAIESMEGANGDGALWEERAVGLFGTANVNVFVGAFFNLKLTDKDISFRDFLRKFAPYENEKQLRQYLESLGFEIVFENKANKLDLPEILHCLDKFYATKFEHQKKSPIVVRHDAVQLAILNADLAEQRRSVFVSADRGIRFALQSDGYGAVANSVLTHLGLTQMVELLVGRLASPRGVASLLWMSPVSSDSERIRSYLVGLALREHSVAAAMYLPDVIGEIVEDAGFELQRKNLKLETDSRGDRTEIGRVLERYEKDFFKKMNAEIDRRKQAE